MRKIDIGLFFFAATVSNGCSSSDPGVLVANGGTASLRGGASSNGGVQTLGGATSGGVAVAAAGWTTNAGTSISVGGSTSTGGSSGARDTGGSSGSGGSVSTGGSKSTGGVASLGGAANTGGLKSSGGVVSSGGSSITGGTQNLGGNASTGGVKSSGGTIAIGGANATGGALGGGGTNPTGGASATGGSSGNCPAVSATLYAMGADVSQVPQDEAGGQTRYVDTDGKQKDILEILRNHGFNYVRLRTFVDPKASDGYSSQGYCDLAHTIAMAKRVKQACMGFLLDFHYSDNWADPAKQCIPVAWQAMSLAQMTQQVHDYTYSSVQALVNAGARPDMVQVGNEITPGMLIHICDSTGTPTSTNSVNGSVSNWANLAGFLNAGIKGVHDVDPTIKIMLHIERGGSGSASTTWLNSALSNKVTFDVFGESTYVAYQGQPSVWQSTFDTLIGNSAFSALRFASAEYNNESVTSPAGTTSMRAINDTIFKMASNRGFGTFFWEPTRYGAWGSGLFTWNGTTCAAISSAFAVYDSMRTAYASRL